MSQGENQSLHDQLARWDQVRQAGVTLSQKITALTTDYEPGTTSSEIFRTLLPDCFRRVHARTEATFQKLHATLPTLLCQFVAPDQAAQISHRSRYCNCTYRWRGQTVSAQLDRERRTGTARWEGWHVVSGMWPRFEHGRGESNLARESGIFHWMLCRARSQWLGLLSFVTGWLWLAGPDPNEQVGHVGIVFPFDSWPVDTSPSSWRGPGKPQQQRHDLVGLPCPR